uniref:RNase H domain-containing protein n=1 Tax=Ascaris lumbricoides TaxID=6252 RepID=A0A0M3IQD8_ASCLU
ILPRNITKLEIDVGSRAFIIRQEHEEHELIDDINSRLQTIFYSHPEQVPRQIDLHLCSDLPTTHRRTFRDAILDTTIKVIIRSFDSPLQAMSQFISFSLEYVSDVWKFTIIPALLINRLMTIRANEMLSHVVVSNVVAQWRIAVAYLRGGFVKILSKCSFQSWDLEY